MAVNLNPTSTPVQTAYQQPNVDQTVAAAETAVVGSGTVAGGAAKPGSADTPPVTAKSLKPGDSATLPDGDEASLEELANGVLAFAGVSPEEWTKVSPSNKERFFMAMLETVRLQQKQSSEDSVANAAAQVTSALSQAGSLLEAASKMLTMGIVQLVAGVVMGGIQLGMQGVSLWKMAKSQLGEGVKAFKEQLTEMNTAVKKAVADAPAKLEEINTKMADLTKKASEGVDVTAELADLKTQLKSFLPPAKFTEVSGKLDTLVASAAAKKDITGELTDLQQDLKRYAEPKGAKAAARANYLADNPVMDTALKQMEFAFATVKKWDFFGQIAGAGEKAMNAGGTMASSESKKAEADAATSAAQSAQASATKDVAQNSKASSDDFAKKVIDFLDRMMQLDSDAMSAITRGK